MRGNKERATTILAAAAVAFGLASPAKGFENKSKVNLAPAVDSGTIFSYKGPIMLNDKQLDSVTAGEPGGNGAPDFARCHDHGNNNPGRDGAFGQIKKGN